MSFEAREDWRDLRFTPTGPMNAMEVARPLVMSPEIHRTAPYSFEELAARWSCSVDTVERVVRHRFLKVGRTRMVRPGTLLKIEEEMEGAR